MCRAGACAASVAHFGDLLACPHAESPLASEHISTLPFMHLAATCCGTALAVRPGPTGQYDPFPLPGTHPLTFATALSRYPQCCDRCLQKPSSQCAAVLREIDVIDDSGTGA